VVEPGWQAVLTAAGPLELQRVQPRATQHAIGTEADPVMLEVFNNLFMNIAEQMGLRLQNTAYSVNIKERLDFSCALFDAEGELIANAPHMPVHLGSMSESIKTVIARNPAMQPGDVYVLNDPYHGGTHLPDVTVVTPVYLTPGDARPSFYVASRGHHADIGGSTPGSMPPFSKTIDEEGVLFDNFLLVRDGRCARPNCARSWLGPLPGAQPRPDHRRPARADRRQREGRAGTARDGGAVRPRHGGGLHEACAGQRRGIGAPRHHRAEGRRLRAAAGQRRRIVVKVTVDAAARGATIDFTGTSAQLPNNFNAPKAVTMAAVLYVFRTLVDDDIPLNAGCLKPLQVIVPEGCMLNPRPAGGGGGRQRRDLECVTNALYGALGVMAASQCTMNNFTFGNATHQYYETISGGSGAGPGLRRHQRGADAHDQLAPDRPRGAGVPLPGAAGQLRHPRRLGRRGPLARRRRRRAPRALPGGR
jgi:5-oxoprolinase (ATP-hydrolysing)